MPSVQQVKSTLVKLPELERQIYHELNLIRAANAKVGRACLTLDRPPNTDENFQSVSQEIFHPHSDKFTRLQERWEDARLEYHALRAGVLAKKITGKIADLIKNDALDRYALHKAKVCNWDGQQAQTLLGDFLEYHTTGMLLGKDLQDTLSSLTFKDALGGLEYTWAETATAENKGVVGTDEDGSIVFYDGTALQILYYSDLEELFPDGEYSKDSLDAAQLNYLSSVIQTVKDGMVQNGGIASWHRYEERAVRAFIPDWAIRPTDLAMHLLNVLYNITAEAAGIPAIKILRNDTSMPYASVELINRSLASELDVEWYGDEDI